VSACIACVGGLPHNYHHDQHHQTHNKPPSTDSFTQFIQLEGSTKTTDSPTRISGRLKLSGIQYDSSCTCSTDKSEIYSPVKNTFSPCLVPNLYRIRIEDHNHEAAVDPAIFKQILGKPADVKIVELSSTSFSCIDDRSYTPIVGAPGGEFGEFLVALNEYEKVRAKNLTAEETKNLLVGWLNWNSNEKNDYQFYFHSDEKSINTLNSKLTSGQVPDMTSPRGADQAALLEQLIKPANQGCSFTRSVLMNPDKFGFRLDLVQYLIQAFFNILWDKTAKGIDQEPLSAKINFVISPTPTAPTTTVGSTAPKTEQRAWVNVRASQHCDEDNQAPAIPSIRQLLPPDAVYGDVVSVFVNHPRSAGFLRQRLAKYLVSRVPALSIEQLTTLIHRRAELVMETAADLVAYNVPYYTVSVE